jgi:SNF2 family DNA or RNA helicase
VRADGDFDVQVDGGGADPAELVRAWKRKLAVVPLLDGTWAPLPVAWMDNHGAALEALLAARDARGRVARGKAVALVDALQGLDAPLPPDLGALRVLAGHFESLPEVVLPADVQATLRPYQLQGVAWMDWLRGMGMGGILADDMGLGKTVQTLVALRLASAVPAESTGGVAEGASPPPHERRARHLVVAPTSVVRNWISEAARFVPTLRTCLYHGARRVLDPDADIVVTTYALLRLDLDVLRGTRWTTVVLDEAQAIKNPDSQAARAAFALEADLRLALSGTPIENRLEELWSAFHFANPGLLGSLEDFRDRYASPIESGDRAARDGLRRRIRPFVLRRLKKEVAKDLPPRTDIVLRCALSTEEREIYERVRSLGKAEVASFLEGGNVMQVLEVLLRMRQAACHSGLVPGAIAPGEEAPSAKLDLLCEQLEEVVAEGHRALVFSQWTSMLDRVGPALDARGIGWVRLDGATRDRAAVVADFARADGPPVFLLSLKAGGTGLNLTAADYVFHLDPWWNPAVEDQATDRAHRIGQDRPVVSCKLVAEDTVEERILELQARKRALVGAALDEEALARSLSRDDLAALFD